MNDNKAYLLGILHDASIINRKDKGIYGFELEQKNREFIEYIAEVIYKVYSVKPKIETRNRTWGTYYRIRVHSKKIFQELQQFKFNNLLINSSKEIKRNLIRGLFDAEGSVSHNEVRIFSKDKNLLKSSKKAIEYFGINCGSIVVCCKDVLQLPIYRKYDKNRFMEIFKPKHPDRYISF